MSVVENIHSDFSLNVPLVVTLRTQMNSLKLIVSSLSLSNISNRCVQYDSYSPFGKNMPANWALLIRPDGYFFRNFLCLSRDSKIRLGRRLSLDSLCAYSCFNSHLSTGERIDD